MNQVIRDARGERGELTDELEYQTSEGTRAFAAGDRILFRQNDRALGVKNGMLGTVEHAGQGRLDVPMDSAKGEGRGKAVAIDLGSYAAVDHGYATAIHKSQGATVDRTWVLASGSMDRHLTNVAMTRHRDGVHYMRAMTSSRESQICRCAWRAAGLKKRRWTMTGRVMRSAEAWELESGSVVPLELVGEGLPKKGRFDGLSWGHAR